MYRVRNKVIKKNEILPFVTTGMEFEAIVLCEMIQKKKEKYHMIPLLCGYKKKKKDEHKNI